MYHFEVRVGESPGLATVKAAPLESTDEVEPVNWSDAPWVKSMVKDFPRAGSAGQVPGMELAAGGG